MRFLQAPPAFLLVHAPPPKASCASARGPTFFKPNLLLDPFQSLVDTYGVPRASEANPALFAAALFPFLFGVMFGDVGHGLLLLLAAVFLIAASKSNTASSQFVSKAGEMGEMILNARCVFVCLCFCLYLSLCLACAAFAAKTSLWRTGVDSVVPTLQLVELCRFALLLMALHSIFAGCMYNEVFSVGLDIFGSKWKSADDASTGRRGGLVMPRPEVYPFGVDPAWRGASNELLFLNSLKMKLAVLVYRTVEVATGVIGPRCFQEGRSRMFVPLRWQVGFAHMTLGILLKCSNAIYFGHTAELVLEAIPQLLFFSCLIGYLVFLIVFKWVTPSGLYAKPSLIAVMINFVMGSNEDQPQELMFEAQPQVETVGGEAADFASPKSNKSACAFFLRKDASRPRCCLCLQVLRICLVVLLPVMFLGKPLFEVYMHRKRRAPDGFFLLEGDEPRGSGSNGTVQLLPLHCSNGGAVASGVTSQARRSISAFSVTTCPSGQAPGNAGSATGAPAEEPQELLLQQMIEQIEFVLGCISNTASYLRLWALSLAHQQLSLVFFEETIGMAFHPNQSLFARTFKVGRLSVGGVSQHPSASLSSAERHFGSWFESSTLERCTRSSCSHFQFSFVSRSSSWCAWRH